MNIPFFRIQAFRFVPVASLLTLPFFALTPAACSTASLSLSSDGGLSIDYAAKGGQLTLESWRKIAEATGGVTYESKSSADMASLVGTAFKVDLAANTKVDIVFAVDTTGSMGDDIDAVKEKLGDIVDALAATNPDWQVGVTAYRDKGDDYVSKTFQTLTNDKAKVLAAIAELKAAQGGDFREHVYAGLDSALNDHTYRDGADHRILLIGDAPPHEGYTDDPRNFDSVTTLAKAKGVKVHAIGVYCDTACQLLVSALDSATGGVK